MNYFAILYIYCHYITCICVLPCGETSHRTLFTMAKASLHAVLMKNTDTVDSVHL